MKRPKKRLRKKYYKKLTWLICYYISQTNIWRERFFEAKDGEKFDLSDSDLASASYMRASVLAEIRRFRLRFTATVRKYADAPDSHETDEFYPVDLYFGPKEFPDISSEATIFKGYKSLMQ